jgi:CheY-like chemotaxis protein
VRDTGPGVPADKREAIFAPFVQADDSMSRRHGGAGLGLAISARLVELMGGQIWLESEIGQGSTFHFLLPLGPAPAAAAPSPVPPPIRAAGPIEPPSAPPLRVLVAEDNAINQALVRSLLQKQGHTVVLVANGRDVIEAYQQQEFDVVLMDVQMPDIDGFEATALIRRHQEQTGRRTPIIAMTAHAMKGDRERCLAMGMDGYLAKPMAAAELWQLLARLGSEALSGITQNE